MSAIEFIMKGGMAQVGGDMPENDQHKCREFIKKFGEQIAQLGRTSKIPANHLSIFKMSFLFVGKDSLNYHFAFIDKAGGNEILYRDLSNFGQVSPEQLFHDITMNIGEVNWGFTYAIQEVSDASDEIILKLANEYITSISETMNQKKSDMSKTVSEISKEITIFNADHKGQKTAFIMMQFGNTPAHRKTVATIKETLKKHSIIGLRADDKEYAADLFANIETYMHCCDFGIAVFERIDTETFNPNVSMEVGYMLGRGRRVCLLKDKTLKSLPTDLMGKLYKPFDTQDIENTLPEQLEKWLQDKGEI